MSERERGNQRLSRRPWVSLCLSRHMQDWHWPTILAAVVLAVAAAALRFANLTSLPSGLHGDEAIVGLEARRILDEVWIGIYSPHAAGQPAAPLYLWAPVVALLGNTILAVRILPAFVGTLTVVLTFLLLRRDLGNTGAFAAALLLALVTWHLHYSRIAFPLVFWPLLILVSQWALVTAFATRQREWWVAAGILCAAGVYLYNAHWMFGGAVALAGLAFLAWDGRERMGGNLRNVTFAGVWAFAVLAPVLHLILDSESVYTSHFERDSLIGSPDWEAQASLVAKAGLITDRYLDVWWLLLGRGTPDRVDAGGVIPLVTLPLLIVVAWGIATGWSRLPFRWWWLSSVCVLLVMPLASALTLDGIPRRPFAMVIPLVVLGGIAVADLSIRIKATIPNGRIRHVLVSSIVLSLVLISLPGIFGYFTTFAQHQHQRWVFLQDFTEASSFMNEVPGHARILVASQRHSMDYESRQFLAPAAEGEDWKTPGEALPGHLGPGPTVVVLVGPRQEHTASVLNNGAEIIVTGEDTDGLFTALCLRCSAETLAELRERAAR